MKNKKLTKAIEMIEQMGEFYDNDRKTYNIHTFTILTRRWEALKFVITGIQTEEENKQALKLLEELMDKKTDKDKVLLLWLVEAIESFESVYYNEC